MQTKARVVPADATAAAGAGATAAADATAGVRFTDAGQSSFGSKRRNSKLTRQGTGGEALLGKQRGAATTQRSGSITSHELAHTNDTHRPAHRDRYAVTEHHPLPAFNTGEFFVTLVCEALPNLLAVPAMYVFEGAAAGWHVCSNRLYIPNPSYAPGFVCAIFSLVFHPLHFWFYGAVVLWALDAQGVREEVLFVELLPAIICYACRWLVIATKYGTCRCRCCCCCYCCCCYCCCYRRRCRRPCRKLPVPPPRPNSTTRPARRAARRRSVLQRDGAERDARGAAQLVLRAHGTQADRRRVDDAAQVPRAAGGAAARRGDRRERRPDGHERARGHGPRRRHARARRARARHEGARGGAGARRSSGGASRSWWPARGRRRRWCGRTRTAAAARGGERRQHHRGLRVAAPGWRLPQAAQLFQGAAAEAAACGGGVGGGGRRRRRRG